MPIVEETRAAPPTEGPRDVVSALVCLDGAPVGASSEWYFAFSVERNVSGGNEGPERDVET